MSVHKDKERGIWYFSYRDKVTGKQRIKKCKEWTLKRHAVQAEAEFLAKTTQIEIDQPEYTFNEVFEMYINHVSTIRKASTVKTIRLTLGAHAIPYFNGRKIKLINVLEIENYQTHLLSKTHGEDKKKYKNVYLSKVQTYTRLVFDYALKHQFIEFNPFDRVGVAKHHQVDEEAVITIITKEEYDRFLSVITKVEDRAIFSILYWGGLRIGEALGLRIESYNREKKELHVNLQFNQSTAGLTGTKTGKKRYVTLPNDGAKEIDNLLDFYEEKGYVIKPNYNLLGVERKMSKSRLFDRKKEYIKESEIPPITFKDLRHTHASTLIQLGFRPIDIARRLGHSVEQVNNTYGHLFEDDKIKLIDALNNL